MPVSDAAVLDVLRQLSHDIRGMLCPACGYRLLPAAVPALSSTSMPPADLDVGTAVDRHQSLSAVQFLREYVAANKPVLLTGEPFAALRHMTAPLAHAIMCQLHLIRPCVQVSLP
jgi:hypothetical protein